MQDTKQSNPKDIIGIRKLAFSALPWRVLTYVGLAMMEGAAKYGRHNYRAAGARASVYFDAVVARHLTDWWEGNDIDPDSGLHHIDKAISGLMVLRDSMLEGNFIDDRPPRGRVDLAELNDLAAKILDKHADKSPHHYTISDGWDVYTPLSPHEMDLLKGAPEKQPGLVNPRICIICHNVWPGECVCRGVTSDATEQPRT